MALYTETVVADVRLRYENTEQTLASIGAEFSISASNCHRRWSFPESASCRNQTAAKYQDLLWGGALMF